MSTMIKKKNSRQIYLIEGLLRLMSAPKDHENQFCCQVIFVDMLKTAQYSKTSSHIGLGCFITNVLWTILHIRRCPQWFQATGFPKNQLNKIHCQITCVAIYKCTLQTKTVSPTGMRRFITDVLWIILPA